MSDPDQAHAHPHDTVGGVPDRLPAADVRALSQLEPRRALSALAVEWLGIAVAIAAALWLAHPAVYAIAIVFIGARQHALTVLGHDASHYRFLPSKKWNDAIGNLFMQWPLFISVAGFRKFHGDHHKYFGLEGDGNRTLWRTHDKDGALTREWTYPKTRAQLAVKLLRHSVGLTGLRWVLRGLLSVFFLKNESVQAKVLRVAYYAAVAAALTWLDAWLSFALLWVLPLCTWHITIQYMRLIAEHSAVSSEDPAYQGTRTTIPTRLEALLILPRNIGYHLEHHWYPSVPFYRLPDLHARLLREPRFAANADISTSILRSLVHVTRRETPS